MALYRYGLYSRGLYSYGEPARPERADVVGGEEAERVDAEVRGVRRRADRTQPAVDLERRRRRRAAEGGGQADLFFKKYIYM